MRFAFLFYASTCLWLVNPGALLWAQTDRAEISVITEAWQFVDTAGVLKVEEAVKLMEEGEFSKVPTDIINFSIRDSVIWLAFKLDRSNDGNQYLSPGNESTVWRATLYAQDSTGSYQNVFHYDHLKPNTRTDGLPFRTVAMLLPAHGEEHFLLRIAARRHRNYILKTGDQAAMTSYLIQKDTIPVAFIAFMMCIFIYNIFLFVSTKDIVFIPYLVYLLFVTFAVPFHSGYVLFSTEWMWQGSPFYTVWTSIGYLSGAVFAILYLNLRETSPKVTIWISMLTFILVVVVPILDASKWLHVGIMAKIVSTSSLLFNLSLWGSGVRVWLKGRANARFYVFGWLFAISSMVLFILSTNGIIPFNNFVEQSFYYGFAIEAVLFAFALGDRMNVLKREKRVLEVEYVNYITEQNWFLAKQSFMNSHMLRAPLSRVMGLLNLLKFTKDKTETDELLGHVEQSAQEMDKIAKQMSTMLEKQGFMDQYQTEFDEVKKSIYKDMEDGSQADHQD